MTEEAPEKTRPNRMSRQKQKTRGRLIDAALAVMARKGPDAATINDITEEADVGFGSFYNHFESKEEILWAAADELFQRIGPRVDESIGTIADPLEVVVAGIRLFIGMLTAKPIWLEFLLRVCMVPGFEKMGLFPRMFRDLGRAEAAGRLRIADPVATTYAIGGALLFLCVGLRDGRMPLEESPTRVAAMALRLLGVGEEEVARLVARPLPELPDDLFP